jgi:RHS repeat-associated protein
LLGLPFGGQRVAMRDPDNTLTWLHADHLGSTSLATDGGGGEVARQLYYPFGGTRWASVAPLPTDFGFTGQRNQSTIGLYDYHARFYDPLVGRFVSADSIVPNPGDPQDFNRYSYVRNNPLKYTDPTGHADWVGDDCGDGSGNIIQPQYSYTELVYKYYGWHTYGTGHWFEPDGSLAEGPWEDFFTKSAPEWNGDWGKTLEGDPYDPEIFEQIHMYAALDQWQSGNAIGDNTKRYLAQVLVPMIPYIMVGAVQIIHKNSNVYVGHQGVYEIRINGSVHKYGKADMTELSSTGLPVRLQSQINRLSRQYPTSQVTGRVLYQNQSISTLDVKKVETAYVQSYYNTYGVYPPDNQNHPGIRK